MKKILIFTIIFVMLITVQAHSFSLGVWGGYNFLLEDVDDNTTKNGVAFGAKLGLIDLPIISFGVIGGYLSMYSYETDILLNLKYEGSSFDIPVIAYSQLEFAGIYVLGGIGAHLLYSTEETINTLLSKTTEEKVKSNARLGVTLGGGYKIGMGPIGLEIGALYHLVFDKEKKVDPATLKVTEDENTIKMLTVYAGLNFGI